MKLINQIFVLTLFVFIGLQTVSGQTPLATAEIALTYQFQSSSGTNASAVTFIPGPNVYITAIAGNTAYPLEVFDAQGKTLNSQEVGIDIRGMWYNPATKMLEANAYAEEGWFSMSLDGNGIPSGTWNSIRTGMHQPIDQSVLSYVVSKKKLVTITDGTFSYWGRKNGKEKLRYQNGTPGDTDWYINPYVAAYTGNDAYPIAVLELNGAQILYFDLKGKYLGSTAIPDGLPEMDGFRFSFANKRAFIYDETSRTWTGYRVF